MLAESQARTGRSAPTERLSEQGRFFEPSSKPKGRPRSSKEKKEISQKPRAQRRQAKQAERGADGRDGIVTAWNLFCQQQRREFQSSGNLASRQELQTLGQAFRNLPADEKARLKTEAAEQTFLRRSLRDPGAAAQVAQEQARRGAGSAGQSICDASAELRVATEPLEGAMVPLEDRLVRFRQAARSHRQALASASAVKRRSDTDLVLTDTRRLAKRLRLLQEVPPEFSSAARVVCSAPDLSVVEWRVPSSVVAERALSAAAANIDVRSRVLAEWHALHSVVEHNSLPPLPPPGAKPSKCSLIGRCVCTGLAARNLSLFHGRLTRTLSTLCPPHSHFRDLLRNAALILGISSGAEGSVIWLHVAHVNLNDWSLVFLELKQRDMPGGSLTLLRASEDCVWKTSWDALAALDLSVNWFSGLGDREGTE